MHAIINNLNQAIEFIPQAVESAAHTAQIANRICFAGTQLLEHSPTQQIATKHIFTPPPTTKVAPWSHNFRNVRENRELLNDYWNADLEYLTKVQICNSLEKGAQITLQTSNGPANYTVYHKIAAGGLVSYALKPQTPDFPPLIVFRCTEPDPLGEQAINSIQNDVESNIGEKGWNATKSAFDHLMNDPKFRSAGQKVRVAGYSLGGAHAQHFIAAHHASVSHGVFYNNPSISAETAETFAKTMQNVHRDEPLILQIFRTCGDPFHHFGGKHLGCGVDHPNVQTQLLEMNLPNQQTFDLSLHSKRIFKTENFDYTVSEWTDPELLSRKLDNTRRGPVTMIGEILRKESSPFLVKIVSTCASFKKGIISCLEELAGRKKRKKLT